MRRLISVKWNFYGKRGAILDLVINLIYTILWTLVGVTFPQNGKELYLPLKKNIWRITIHGLIVLFTLFEIKKQIAREWQQEISYFVPRNTSSYKLPLLSFLYHYHPLFTIVILSLPLSSTLYHCHPLVTIVILSLPLSSSLYHCHPLFTIVNLSLPLSSSLYHCHPLFTIVILSLPLSSSLYHCHALFTTVILSTCVILSLRLSSSLYHCHPLFTTVIVFSPLSSSLYHCHPLFTTVILSSPLSSSLLETVHARQKLVRWREWRVEQLEQDKQYCHPRWPQEREHLESEIQAVKSRSKRY